MQSGFTASEIVRQYKSIIKRIAVSALHEFIEVHAVELLRHRVDLIAERIVLHQRGQHDKGIDDYGHRGGQAHAGEDEARAAGGVHLLLGAVGQEGEKDAQRPQRQGQHDCAAGGHGQEAAYRRCDGEGLPVGPVGGLVIIAAVGG